VSREAVISLGESPLGLGGLARAATTQAAILQKLGWSVRYVSPDDVSRPFRLRKFSALDFVWLSLQISRLARQASRDSDVLFSHGLCGAFGSRSQQVHLYHGTCAGLARACRARLSKLEFLSLAGAAGMCEAVSGWQSRPRLAVSATVASEVGRFYGVRNATVVHNVIDAEHFRSPATSPGGDFRGVVVGRMDFGKGRQALAALVERLPSGHGMRVAGEFQGTPPATSACQLLGSVPYADLPALYASANYLLCLSRYEGFGLTPLEAWAAGIPVITTNIGVIRELRSLEPSLDAMVVDDPDDVDGFLSRIRRLQAEPELGRRQAAWGQQLVFERFSLKSALPRYRRVLEEL
jgi:glycosyltransferase involved in cell wall biosynthesis